MTEDYRIWTNQVIEKIRTKFSWIMDKNKEKIPYTTDADGNYDNKADKKKEWNQDDGLNWWTNGFFRGIACLYR